MKMKSNKFWSIILMVVMMLGDAIVFSSCDKDGNDASSISIVGTWSCTRHYYGGTDTFTFKSNGTYTWSYKGSRDYPNDYGNYAFDPSRSTLVIHNRKGTIWSYVIISLTSSSFTIMDEDGDTYCYQKD